MPNQGKNQKRAAALPINTVSTFGVQVTKMCYKVRLSTQITRIVVLILIRLTGCYSNEKNNVLQYVLQQRKKKSPKNAVFPGLLGVL